MKRVLHVHAGNLYGGVERVLETVHHEQLRRAGISHEFALCFDGRLRRSLVAAGAVVHELGPARVSRPDQILRARRRLAGVLRDSRPDVVLTYSSWSHALFAATVRSAARPLATWLHDVPGGRHWLERLAARHAPDLVVANSRFTAERAALLYPDAPVVVVHPPVQLRCHDTAVRDEVRRELGTAAGATVIIQAGRFDRGKGIHVLIEALERLADRPAWQCWVVGAPQTAAERRYAAELGARVNRKELADRVRFLGMRTDVPRLMGGADIYCQPNVNPESFGVVFVEAMHAGLPVVTSALGAAPEVVPTECGSLVPPGDAVALANELTAYLGDGHRFERARRIGPARAQTLCDAPARLRDLEDALARIAG